MKSLKHVSRFVCLFGTLSAMSLNISRAAEIAIVDYADEWTKVAAVAPSLDHLKIPYDNLTADVEKGNLKLSGQRLLFLSSMVTNSVTLHQNLDKNAQIIQDFVKGGGIVIEPTQADQNEANVDWLPAGLKVVRSDPDSPIFRIKDAKHPLFNAPNKMEEADFTGWGHQGWPTVWEVISQQEGFTVLAEGGPASNMIIGEATHGTGKFVMLCIAPDKYAQAGNDDRTKEKAMLFFENLVTTYLPQAVSPAGRLATTWVELKRR